MNEHERAATENFAADAVERMRAHVRAKLEARLVSGGSLRPIDRRTIYQQTDRRTVADVAGGLVGKGLPAADHRANVRAANNLPT